MSYEFELQNIMIGFFGGWLLSKVSTNIILELKLNNLRKEIHNKVESEIVKKVQPALALLGAQQSMQEQIHDPNANVNTSSNVKLPPNSKPIYVG